MIMCKNPDCKYKWASKGTWFCPVCTENTQYNHITTVDTIIREYLSSKSRLMAVSRTAK